MNDKGFFAKLRQESTVIPPKMRKFAKFLVIGGLTVGACLLAVSAVTSIVALSEGRHPVTEFVVGLAAVGLGIAIVSLYITLLGYVYGDARRRGMPAGLWVLLVLLIPNMIGFIVYFILRRSIFAPCPHCGRGADVGQIYCSSCGHKLDLTAA